MPLHAERKAGRIVENETTKVYCPPEGAPGFTDGVLNLLFTGHDALASGRVAAVQTPGGCGALRLAAELLKRTGAASITAGAPTWANHKPLFEAAGHKIDLVPYYDAAASAIEFDAFLDAAKKLGPKDVLLLHGACHNPTGADLSTEQIDTVFDVAADRGFLPLIDMAYLGFANGLAEDAYIVRAAAERLPEALVTFSCSKNFGLYRERTGALVMIGKDAANAAAVKSHTINVARGAWSMPPAHGGIIVSEILRSEELSKLWRDELEAMRLTVRGNRKMLVNTARELGLGNRLAYITEQHGMFSLLPTTEKQAAQLRDDHGVYVVGAGRINLCGVDESNVRHLVEAVKSVLDK